MPTARSWAAPAQGRRYSPARQAVRTVHYSTNHSCRATLLQISKAGRRVGPALHDNASSLASTTSFWVGLREVGGRHSPSMGLLPSLHFFLS